MFGFIVCDSCKARLGQFTDGTLRRYVALYDSTKNHSFEDEIRSRLDILEKDYKKKRFKLLYIMERLKRI